MASAQGKYKGIRFRSLLELSFLLEVETGLLNGSYGDCISLKEVKAEPIRIPYRIGKGKQRHYIPDFMIRDAIYEIKPTSRVYSKINLAKWETLKQFCLDETRRYSCYVLTEKDFKYWTLEEIVKSVDQKHIEWSSGTLKRRRFAKKIKGGNRK